MASVHPVLGSAELCLIPAGLMLLGGVLAFGWTPSFAVLSATQHFSAGILLAAIGLELLPKLISNGKGLWGSVAIAVGFAAGVVLMLGVKYVTEKLEPEEDSDDEEEDTGKESSALLASGDSAGSAYGSNAAAIDIPEAKATFDGEARALSPRDRFKKAVSAVKFINRMKRGADKRAVSRIAIAMRSAELKRHLSRPAMQKELAEPSADPEPEPELGPFPLSLSMAVGVDSIMDGVLLGIVYVVSTHAGQIMAVATAIEMLFLGVTYSVSVQPHGCLKSAFAVVLQPVLLVAGGAIGAAATNELSDNPNIFVGVIAFGIATLLYLVTHELLVEAYEAKDHDEVPLHVSMFVFIGFLATLLGARAFPES